jgi:hypothetical protein
MTRKSTSDRNGSKGETGEPGEGHGLLRRPWDGQGIEFGEHRESVGRSDPLEYAQ